ncbi:MAG: hypothetical protein ACO3UU_12975 [Minisyncoccia bacterium]|jgi:hypothetical protein
MAGSDIFANSTSTTGSNVALFGGPTRLKAFIITPTAASGSVVFADGDVTKFEVTTGASADSGPINISLPDEGVKFTSNLQANLTNVGGVTVFFA